MSTKYPPGGMSGLEQLCKRSWCWTGTPQLTMQAPHCQPPPTPGCVSAGDTTERMLQSNWNKQLVLTHNHYVSQGRFHTKKHKVCGPLLGGTLNKKKKTILNLFLSDIYLMHVSCRTMNICMREICPKTLEYTHHSSCIITNIEYKPN